MIYFKWNHEKENSQQLSPQVQYSYALLQQWPIISYASSCEKEIGECMHDMSMSAASETNVLWFAFIQ